MSGTFPGPDASASGPGTPPTGQSPAGQGPGTPSGTPPTGQSPAGRSSAEQVPSESLTSEPPTVDEDGQLVGEAAGSDDASELVGGELATLTAELAELTSDLQRLQADYANYRRRVERDRELIREQAVAATLAELLPVLDDIGRARAHDELVGAFKSVGEVLESSASKLGLERFGEVGEAFDPEVHEALSHVVSPEVTETTCVEVYQPGYRYAGRVVRPARVVVADPA